MKFEEFVATKRKHNHLLRELGGETLLDSYIVILIRSGLPENLKQAITHLCQGHSTPSAPSAP